MLIDLLVKVIDFLLREKKKKKRRNFPPPLPNPFKEGDWVRLKGPTNPYKGCLLMRNKYQVRHSVWYWYPKDHDFNISAFGAGYIKVRDDRGIIGQYDIHQFELIDHGKLPIMDDTEYNEAMQAQALIEP